MALGKPAIPDPRVFDLRAFQSTTSNIRQRIEALEAAVTLLQNTGNAALAAAIAVLQSQVKALQGGGTGSVTSVGATVPSFMSVTGTPITTAGTLAFSFDPQQSGLFLAGPVNGADAEPVFRGIEWYDDIPLYSTTSFTSGLSGDEIILVERYGTFVWTTLRDILTQISGVAFLNAANIFTKGQTVLPVALTDAATIAVDASLSNTFYVTLGGNRTLGAPTNWQDGQVLNIYVKQPSSGGPYTLSLTNLDWTGGTPPSVSTAANAVDLITTQKLSAFSTTASNIIKAVS